MHSRRLTLIFLLAPAFAAAASPSFVPADPGDVNELYISNEHFGSWMSQCIADVRQPFIYNLSTRRKLKILTSFAVYELSPYVLGFHKLERNLFNLQRGITEEWIYRKRKARFQG